MYVPIVTANSHPEQTFRSPVFFALLSGLLIKVIFGILGSIAYEKNTNLFDNLMFSNNAPFYVVVSLFIFTGIIITFHNNILIVFAVLPVVVRSSLMAKYFIYIGGMCEVPCNYFSGIVLPWIFGALLNHLEIYVYLINWFTLATGLYVYFVCPMFMWSKSVKEATIFENNFKQSLQMICDGDYNKHSIIR